MSNYKEVQTLLKSRGIDLDHNRFLILQVCSAYFISIKSMRWSGSRVKLNPSRK